MTDVIIDIGLPAYRRATFLMEAVESVLAQSHTQWRLTVSDNGPGGGDVERAIRPYLSDERILHFVTGVELTLADNWTNAISQGTGKYVALLNDDDRWHPDFLRARLNAMEANPDCGFAFGEWIQVEGDGRISAASSIRFPEGVLTPTVLAPLFTRENPVGPSTTVIRREALRAVGGSFDGRWQYCDWEMWARLAAHAPVYYVARTDSDLRRHASAMSYEKSQDPGELIRLLDHLERLFRASGFAHTRRQRARIRSDALLHSALAAYLGGGWAASSALYRQAIREYPPSVLGVRSRSILARTLLGQRGVRAMRRAFEVAGLRH